ncbi:MAG: Mut7-C RNAse domain-containing protein [Ignavibacterium sp.]
MKSLFIRFYEELNDFLPQEKRKVRFEHKFFGQPSIKDLIESLGIPHTEIDLIIVNGKSVNFSYIVQDKDEISVYPIFESFDISNIQQLREIPLYQQLKSIYEIKFIVDCHLGKLAKYMRLLGLDTFYNNNIQEKEFINISINEKRIILTKNRNLLKRNEVINGYWIRNENVESQIKEVIQRFKLKKEIKYFLRCLICNSELKLIEKEKIINRIPSKVKEWCNEFYYCKNCDKIYWKGSHYNEMLKTIKELQI